MIKKLLVKLTPYDRYFFGGNNTFGEGDSVNYFVKSKYFPQQTSLLGLVRYQLMVQNNNGAFIKNKIVDPAKAAELINHKSFDINDREFSFGKIKELSPVFIAGENEEYLFPANREYQWDNEEKKYVLREFKILENSNSKIYQSQKFIPYLGNYIAKEDLPDLLISTDKDLYNYSKVFLEHKQVGIRKNYIGKTDEKAFYVQFFYKLEKGCSFAFILHLEDDIKFYSSELVTLGGEQSKFRMEVEETKNEFEALLPAYQGSKESHKIVLISDAYVSNKIFDNCDFAITDTIEFNSIKSTVNTTKYSSMDRIGNKGDELSKSGQYNFFKKGSVFYSQNISKITRYLDEKDSLKKIGYNHYKIVNKREE
ncbi:MAG: type III-B CRISPR module-associated protein Cmr3 [Ignavibacteriales bacterium]|nr:type III-B CRISPR module-associated protein Cmr3 [Ignavibacteriales bacterium]